MSHDDPPYTASETGKRSCSKGPEMGVASLVQGADPTPVSKVYTCPMYPKIKQDGPGSCRICNMTLVLGNVGRNGLSPQAGAATVEVSLDSPACCHAKSKAELLRDWSDIRACA